MSQHRFKLLFTIDHKGYAANAGRNFHGPVGISSSEKNICLPAAPLLSA
jgi:hypothetical protein